ncbi:MAG: hypothetical protein U9N46_05195 [Euryarchaeota archaeon]|nr:hypothetical protein [Euryarchaeota archaeon]
MDRSESVKKLVGLLSADEYGDLVSELLVEKLAGARRRNIFVAKLQELANELQRSIRRLGSLQWSRMCLILWLQQSSR